MTTVQVINKDRYLPVFIKYVKIIYGSIIFLFVGIFISNTFFGTDIPVEWDALIKINLLIGLAFLLFMNHRVNKIFKILGFGTENLCEIEKMKIMKYNTETWSPIDSVVLSDLHPSDKIRLYIRVPYEDSTTVIQNNFKISYLNKFEKFKVSEKIKVIYDKDFPTEFLLTKIWFEN